MSNYIGYYPGKTTKLHSSDWSRTFVDRSKSHWFVKSAGSTWIGSRGGGAGFSLLARNPDKIESEFENIVRWRQSKTSVCLCIIRGIHISRLAVWSLKSLKPSVLAILSFETKDKSIVVSN